MSDGSSVLGAGDDELVRSSTSAPNYQLDTNSAQHRQPMDMSGLTFAGQAPAAGAGLSLAGT